jgi:hypothetical protein
MSRRRHRRPLSSVRPSVPSSSHFCSSAPSASSSR